MTRHPLLIQKTMADKLSDKVQVIIARAFGTDGQLHRRRRCLAARSATRRQAAMKKLQHAAAEAHAANGDSAK